MTSPCPSGAVLLGLVDGDLGPDEAAAVEAHLASCPSCRDLARGFRADRPAFPEPELPPGFWASFDARLRARLPRRSSLLRRMWEVRVAVPVPALVAAAAALILLGAVGARSRPVGVPGAPVDRVVASDVDAAHIWISDLM